MNMPRMLVLGLAVIAAIAAVLLVRGFLGGGTPKSAAMVPAPQIPISEVLVAAQPLQPGQPLTSALVRWQNWPKANVDSTFITHSDTPNLDAALKGTVVRAPMVAGEPISSTKFVRADSASFMAATLQPGMRAVSIPITTESGAGGFILPNDRVDLIETDLVSSSPRRFSARIVLTDIRVLAVDQTYKQDKDQKVVLAKTATLELTPAQASLVAKAQAGGPLSLALRPLGDNSVPAPVASNQNARGDATGTPDNSDNTVTIIRFGLVPAGAIGGKD